MGRPIPGGPITPFPTTPKVAPVQSLGLAVVDVPSESLRRGQELFGAQGGGLFGPLDLKHLDLS